MFWHRCAASRPKLLFGDSVAAVLAAHLALGAANLITICDDFLGASVMPRKAVSGRAPLYLPALSAVEGSFPRTRESRTIDYGRQAEIEPIQSLNLTDGVIQIDFDADNKSDERVIKTLVDYVPELPKDRNDRKTAKLYVFLSKTDLSWVRFYILAEAKGDEFHVT